MPSLLRQNDTLQCLTILTMYDTLLRDQGASPIRHVVIQKPWPLVVFFTGGHASRHS